ncbi:MAG: acyl CoA:acetate/3-ketoacid CoA transferase [Rhodospirillaceae bacterium]|nr:acyl CoA:acetate/3-ketoacid CoA transferase [Rhodospirillaceae bacterium]
MAVNIVTAQEAAQLLKDSDIVLVGGSAGMGVADTILEQIGLLFQNEQRPKNLTILHTTGVGAVTEKGLNHLVHKGLVKRVIGGNFGLQLPFMKELIINNEIEAYNFPQGVMCQLYRAMAGGQPGVVSHVGLNTFMDPRLEGGKMNSATKKDLIEVVELAGNEYLFYPSQLPDVALIRGTTADEDGNVSLEHEAATLDALSMAQAAHNAGGKVICQIERMAQRNTLHPQMAKIPGFLIDYFVIQPEQMQNFAVRFDPSRCGALERPIDLIKPDSLDVRRLIARRAAFELKRGAVINLGVGVSAAIPNVLAEEEADKLVHLTIEAGVIGGVPGQGLHFGSAINPRVILDQGYMFDFYDGGGLDIAFVSFAEVDSSGNVNVTRFGNRNDGAGGFINITQNAKVIVFSGTLTGGGLDVEVSQDGIIINREGSISKFVNKVGQISYNGKIGLESGQKCVFITERAVFHLTTQGLLMTEIAPGVDMEMEVLNVIDFDIKVSRDIKEMDRRLFKEGKMGLTSWMLENEKS